MASGYQSLTLFGNIGQQPELRHTQAGTALLSFRLAVSESKKINDEWTEETQWFSCVIWDRRAEALERILNKGDKVMVIGRIENREWEDKQGNKRSSIEVVCREVVLGGGRRQGGQRDTSGSGFGDPESGGAAEDDIPF